jgi:ankyrin repeat protein
MTTLDDLFEAVHNGDALRVDAFLEAQPTLLTAHDPSGNSLLLAALYQGKPDLAAVLVARGAPVNLWEAAALGDVARLQAHLEADPSNLKAHSHDGWTALHLAAHFGHADAVQLLLRHGANVRARSTNPLDNEPLHAALAGRSLDVARLLLDAGADPNAVEHGGYAPLHQAAEPGDLPLIRLLLDRGARPDRKDDQGRTPLDLAEAGGHTLAVDMLRRAASTPAS